MSSYKHILIGLDLTDESALVLDKAVALAQATDAKITIAHVLEPLSFAYGGDMPIDLSEIQNQLQTRAEQELQRLLDKLSYPVEQHCIIVGQTATELHDYAAQISADLIVIGSHGRKGFALLLGSTSNSVLHGASCDVLAVRVHKDKP